MTQTSRFSGRDSPKPSPTNGYDALDGGIGSANSTHGKRYCRIIDALNNCGISDLVDTPKIVIMGSQSSGKSSVMEAISRIPFPRASGTCTRCPAEVRLSKEDKDWECSVQLRLEYNKDGKQTKKIKTIPFGNTMQSLAQVSRRISAAQCAILNPSKSPLDFLGDGPFPSQNEISFSENTICLFVRGRNLVNLTIIYLPGIIANAGDGENANSVALISKMVKNTIAKPNCFILSPITMSEDYQNEVGVTMVREADPEGRRSLEVFTKPDRIGAGDFLQWLPILRSHPCYVVKNPSSEELQKYVSYEQARAKERAFFSQNNWRALGTDVCGRLGSGQLASKLEDLLEKLIKEKLPQTISQIQNLSQDTNERLNSLPVVIHRDHALQHLHIRCNGFAQSIRKELTEYNVDEPVLFVWPSRYLFKAFRAKIFNARPIILPHDTDESNTSHSSSRSSISVTSNKNDNAHGNEDVDEDDADLLSDHDCGVPKDHRNIVRSNIACSKLLTHPQFEPFKLSLTIIQDAVNAAADDRLPGNVPFFIKEKLMRKAVSTFEAPTWQYFDDVVELLGFACHGLVKTHFNDVADSALSTKLVESLDTLIGQQAKICRALVEQLVQMEMSFIFTGNHHYFADKRDSSAKRLCRERVFSTVHGPVSVPHLNGQEGVVLKFLRQVKLDINDLTDLNSYKIPSEIREMIKVAAEVRAYWQVAYKRFIDYVRKAIQTNLVMPVAEKCYGHLSEDLGLFGKMTNEEALTMQQQPYHVREERERLESTKSRLDSALKVIEEYRRGRYSTE